MLLPPGLLLSSRTAAQCPTSPLFFFCPEPGAAAARAEGGNGCPSSLWTSPCREAVTHRWSPQTPGMCSQVFPPSRPARTAPCLHPKAKTGATGRPQSRGVPESFGRPSFSLETGRSDACHPHAQLLQKRCSRKQRESAELFPGKDDECGFLSFFFFPLSEYENCISQVT